MKAPRSHDKAFALVKGRASAKKWMMMMFLVLPTFLLLTVVPLPGRLGTQCAHSGWKYGL
jgi:hypothetical protein